MPLVFLSAISAAGALVVMGGIHVILCLAQGELLRQV